MNIIPIREQLEKKIKILNGFYQQYYLLNGNSYTSKMVYRVVERLELVLDMIYAVVVGFGVCFVVFELSFETFPMQWLIGISMLASCAVFIAFIVFRHLMEWLENKRYSTVKSVTFYFCTKQALARVQSDIDTIKPEVQKLRTLYEEKLQAEQREKYTKTFREAEAVNPQFKALFKIMEEELGAKITKTLSPNEYDLPDDVILEAEVGNLPTFESTAIAMLLAGHKKFRITDHELCQWESIVTVLVGYKKEKDRIGKIVAGAH